MAVCTWRTSMAQASDKSSNLQGKLSDRHRREPRATCQMQPGIQPESLSVHASPNKVIGALAPQQGALRYLRAAHDGGIWGDMSGIHPSKSRGISLDMYPCWRQRHRRHRDA
eukprot:6198541-Pleurochrysis_carterae.AAC.2